MKVGTGRTEPRASVRLGMALIAALDDSGAGPLLELTVSDPEIELAGDSATLIADVASKPLAGGAPLVSEDVALAELDAAELLPTPVTDGLAFGPAAAVLATAGSPAFAGFYIPGTGLDPVAATAVFGEPQAPPADPPADPPLKQLSPVPQPSPPPAPMPPAPKAKKRRD